MENKAHLKNSLKIAGGFFTVALMAFATTRQAAQQQTAAEATFPVPVNSTFNVLQFYDAAAIRPLLKCWNENKNICMVHTGDSHIQPDYFSGRTRTQLQSIKGDGGIGLVFPFSTAKTYSSCMYTSHHTGEWSFAKSFILPAKIPLGAGGMACKTNDKTASFTIDFKQPLNPEQTRITLFYNYQKTSFACLVHVNGQPYTVDVKVSAGSYPSITVPGEISSIKISLQEEGKRGIPFEFYGMSVENAEPKGLVYHAAGVGGAQYKAILHQKLFAEQVTALQPQLVIVDYGTNDYLYDDKIAPTLEKEMQEVVNTIRKAAPQSAILLTTAQDLYWKKRNCKAAIAFGRLVRKIARNNHCLVYDWFNVSGGQGAVLQWQKKGYAQNDFIHLTKKGYELKGDLFSEAITKTIDLLGEKPGMDSLVIPLPDKETVVETVPEKTPGTDHLIQRGETLGGIAKKYGVTVEEIKNWNQLDSDRITAGETLVIRKE